MDKAWFLSSAIDAVSFDCDSTLSKVEGIDELAKKNKTYEKVNELTHKAMSNTGLSKTLYQQRLDIVKPNSKQTEMLANHYMKEITHGVDILLAVLRSLKKKIFIISAGNNPSVNLFANQLNIPINNVFAVDIYFDNNGNYEGFNEKSPIITHYGKNRILDDIKKTSPRILHVGDGMNDLEVKENVTRFVGFGGHVIREKVKEQSEFYINTPSLIPLIPLCLTHNEFISLKKNQRDLVTNYCLKNRSALKEK